MLAAGSTSTAYRIVAWSRDAIHTGWLRGTRLELEVLTEALRDIRNCSLAARGIYATAYERSSGRHGLWRVDRGGGAPALIVEAEYLLHNAASPDGTRVAYTAPVRGADGEAELYVADAAGGRPRRAGTVSRFAIPRWSPREPRVLAHTSSRRVVAVDADTADRTELFEGEFPSPAPLSARIVYRLGDEIRLHGPDRDERLELTGRRRAPLSGTMSWSPDEQLLFAADMGAALGYSVRHFVIDLASRRARPVEKTAVLSIEFDSSEVKP